MKYLVMARTGVAPIPPEKAPDLFKAAKEWIKTRLASGKHDCHFMFSQGGAGFSIVNANSHEELMDEILDYPLYPFLHWEVNALCDSDHSYEALVKLWQKLAG